MNKLDPTFTNILLIAAERAKEASHRAVCALAYDKLSTNMIQRVLYDRGDNGKSQLNKNYILNVHPDSPFKGRMLDYSGPNRDYISNAYGWSYQVTPKYLVEIKCTKKYIYTDKIVQYGRYGQPDKYHAAGCILKPALYLYEYDDPQGDDSYWSRRHASKSLVLSYSVLKKYLKNIRVQGLDRSDIRNMERLFLPKEYFNQNELKEDNKAPVYTYHNRRRSSVYYKANIELDMVAYCTLLRYRDEPDEDPKDLLDIHKDWVKSVGNLFISVNVMSSADKTYPRVLLHNDEGKYPEIIETSLRER